MASRVAPGGAATICLGSDSSLDMFTERAQERVAIADTPDPTSRFPHAPGGATTICLGGCVAEVQAVRGEVGGATALVLGADSFQEALQERQQERSQPVETPDAVARFPQAPGGTASISLGGGPPPSVDGPRGPVGGQATISFGDDSIAEVFAERRQGMEANFETPQAAARFTQGPGGVTSVCLSDAAREASELSAAIRGPVGGPTTVDLGHDPEAEICALSMRGPVGGETTITLGTADAKNVFDERQQRIDSTFETPDALARFPQAPGGTTSIHLGPTIAEPNSSPRGPVGGATTICLGGEGGAEVVGVQPRGPVGGVATVVLGQDSMADSLWQHEQIRSAAVETPDAALRFPQAPGGTASVSLGPSGHDEAWQPRGPVGGATTLLLGDTCPSEMFSREINAVETPEAAPRFSQAPGGTASVDFANTGAALDPIPEATRGPVGGECTFVLGDGSQTLPFNTVQTCDIIETPAAAPRFPQAPGGSSTLVLGGGPAPAEAVSAQAAAPQRPVGGQTQVVLGQDDSVWASSREQCTIETPDAAPRFQQAPGGTTSIILGGDGPSASVVAFRGPVGGATSVVLGSDDAWDEASRSGAAVATPAPVPRFSQAPGGSATVILGGEIVPTIQPQTRTAPGGDSTLILGGDYPHDIVQRAVSSNSFATGSSQNTGNVLTERPSTRLREAPGGRSTICLGDGTVVEAAQAQVSAEVVAEAAQDKLLQEEAAHVGRSQIGATTLVLRGGYPHDIVEARTVSSNMFANGANQNAGNSITDRPTTRLHQAPGGDSTICLGDERPAERAASTAPTTTPGNEAGKEVVAAGPRILESFPATDTDRVGRAAEPKKTVSANAFANGASQNSGNAITGRPTTRLHQAPGGTSTVCLGDGVDGVSGSVSANKFACGASQNVGNSVTDRSTTRVHQAPGGKSSVCLGTEGSSETVNVSTVHIAVEQTKDAVKQTIGKVSNSQPSSKELAALGA